MDALVCRDVVAVVLERRGVEGQQPDRGDAQVRHVVEALEEAAEVPDPVRVAVLVRPHVQLVDVGVLVPERRSGSRPRLRAVGHHMKYSKSCSRRTRERMRKTWAGTTKGFSSTKLWPAFHTNRASVRRSWTWYWRSCASS